MYRAQLQLLCGTMVIDQSKIWRGRVKNRQDVVSSQSNTINLEGLYYNGRKDKTKVKTGPNKITHIIQEHIALVQEHDSQYIDHVLLKRPSQ